MPHENRRSQAEHSSSSAVAHNPSPSGISRPGVQTFQKVMIEKPNEDAIPLQMFDGRNSEIKAFSLPDENKNASIRKADIKPFQLQLNKCIQRYPEEAKDGAEGEYTDSNYPSVRMKLLPPPYLRKTYQIISDGIYRNLIIKYDDGDYYKLDDKYQADNDQKVSLLKHAMSTTAGVQAIREIAVAEEGIGVRAGNTGDVVLKTSGLVTCVGWLLFNEDAAFMQHIIVAGLSGKEVDTDFLNYSVGLVAQNFKQNTKSSPKNLIMQISGAEYPKGLPKWMAALVPGGVAYKINNGDGEISHTVKKGRDTRVVWQNAPITIPIAEYSGGKRRHPEERKLMGELWSKKDKEGLLQLNKHLLSLGDEAALEMSEELEEMMHV